MLPLATVCANFLSAIASSFRMSKFPALMASSLRWNVKVSGILGAIQLVLLV